MNEIEFNGKKYVLKSNVKGSSKPITKKGLTYCIVRTYSAGVFAGWVDLKKKGKEQTVFEAIRLWSWSGACSLSQLANDGVKNPSNCKFAQEVKKVLLKEVIEVIPCTDKAINCIKGVPVWQK